MTTGRLVVLEGVDGVGKTTLVQMLFEHLNNVGQPTIKQSFPGKRDGTLGAHIYRVHHEMEEYNIESVHPMSKQILHIASHIDNIEVDIKPALKGGSNVILDRFWWSTYVYGMVYGVKRVPLLKAIDVELYYWQNVPSIVFLIDVDKPRNREMDSNWFDLKYKYLNLCEQEAGIVILNNGPIEETFVQILSHLEG